MARVIVGVALAALLVTAAYVVLGLGLPGGGNRIGPTTPSPATTESPPAGSGPSAGERVVAKAVVTPTRSAQARFADAGTVAEVLVAVGDAVEAGTPLARLDARGQEVAARQARAALAEAGAGLTRLLAGATLEQIAAARAGARRGAGPLTAGEIAAARSIQARARAELGLTGAPPTAEPPDLLGAQARVEQAEAALAQAELAVARATLRAPLAGTVVEVGVRAGELATAAGAGIVVADLTAWQVTTTDLAESNAQRVRVGDAATIAVEALPGLALPGAVTAVKPVGENRQGEMTYAVTVVPSRPEPRLRWNMTASVAIVVK